MPENIPQSAGWNFFDLQSEYQRMQVPNDEWCLTLLNKDYEVMMKIISHKLTRVDYLNVVFLLQLCDTYPKYLYVPSSASTNILLGSSKFRSKGRLPVLSYLHKNKVILVA